MYRTPQDEQRITRDLFKTLNDLHLSEQMEYLAEKRSKKMNVGCIALDVSDSFDFIGGGGTVFRIISDIDLQIDHGDQFSVDGCAVRFAFQGLGIKIGKRFWVYEVAVCEELMPVSRRVFNGNSMARINTGRMQGSTLTIVPRNTIGIGSAYRLVASEMKGLCIEKPTLYSSESFNIKDFLSGKVEIQPPVEMDNKDRRVYFVANISEMVEHLEKKLWSPGDYVYIEDKGEVFELYRGAQGEVLLATMDGKKIDKKSVSKHLELHLKENDRDLVTLYNSKVIEDMKRINKEIDEYEDDIVDKELIENDLRVVGATAFVIGVIFMILTQFIASIVFFVLCFVFYWAKEDKGRVVRAMKEALDSYRKSLMSKHDVYCKKLHKDLLEGKYPAVVSHAFAKKHLKIGSNYSLSDNNIEGANPGGLYLNNKKI